MSVPYLPSRRRIGGCGRPPSHERELDPVVVDRLLQGDIRVDATYAELDAAIVHILRHDPYATAATVAYRLGVTRETVWRHNGRRRELVDQ